MNTHPHTPVRDIDEISHSISVIADLVNESLSRNAFEGSEPFLRDYELGGLMTAIKQLSSRAGDIAEMLEEHEQRTPGRPADRDGQAQTGSTRRTLAEMADGADTRTYLYSRLGLEPRQGGES